MVPRPLIGLSHAKKPHNPARGGARGRIERFRVEGGVRYSVATRRCWAGSCAGSSSPVRPPASGVRHASRSVLPHGPRRRLVLPCRRRGLGGRRVGGSAPDGDRGPLPVSAGCRSADLSRRHADRLAGNDGQPTGQWQCHRLVDRPGRRFGRTAGPDGHRRDDEGHQTALVARREDDPLPVQPHRCVATPCRPGGRRPPRAAHEHRHRCRGRRLEPRRQPDRVRVRRPPRIQHAPVRRE